MERGRTTAGNKVWFSDLLPERCPVTYSGLKAVLERYGVRYGLLKGTKDIWCRDYMPVPIFDYENILFGYRPDYLRDDPLYIDSISDNMAVCRMNGIAEVRDCRGILLDGGNVIRCGGKVIMTAKVLEENPGYPPRLLLQRLEQLLCAEVILVPWDTEEIYGHVDGLLRSVAPDTVLMTNYSQLDSAMADRFRRVLMPYFKVKEFRYRVPRPYVHNWAYINWLQTDEVLILPKFNVPEDEQAFRQIERLMPQYKGRIEMVDATDLIIHEGCLNCCSWLERISTFDC